MKCLATACDRDSSVPGSAKGYCAKHYHRLAKHGNVKGGKRQLKKTVREYLEFRSVVNEDTGCWNWTGSTNADGYATSRYTNYTGLAHRISYIEYVGEIPQGLQIDHLCNVRNCINPEHLEAVTRDENTRRRDERMRAADAESEKIRVKMPYAMSLDDLRVWLDSRGIDPKDFRVSHGFEMKPTTE